ncbi:2-dehydro-3-deoxyphosphooctonate aldolase (KDO 8-P synthase) [Roseimicrobium gellanilyticum]|uniref:3-deoxy-8-phosphooctulonate synthase n=1 Tax=Roseimicrobium gellanilyticum TaxID=748857 RepID=A0A366HNG8_9BACT|nr:3-deoxy-8-phosphooctulonate synthase [Roseimicrobium gellanilyticum]RBP44573.1 2-dehydro-3-deoxyphosphooctonate aldolase (KDO 8-P synthase) [Roseimicrobium gellanilyticum]
MPAPFLSSLPIVDLGRDVRFDGVQPVFILGPCVIESEAFVWDMARQIKGIADELGLRWVFKASYDKANRSSGKSYRGMSLEEGCGILAAIGKELGVPVTTDVHSPEEATRAAEWIDFLQIPAFLCRQTDLIEAAGRTGRAVNVKKGQFLAPWDVKNIAEKLQSVGCNNFVFTERGTTFGYQNLVADMRSLYWMRELGYRVVMDATHSVQRPGGLGSATGGDGKLAPVLARAAVAAGVDGVFIETHVDPSKALSDGPNQIPLGDLKGLLSQLLRIHEIAKE